MPTLLFDLDDTIITHDAMLFQAREQAIDKFINQLTPHAKHDILETLDKCSNIFWSDPERHRLGRLDLNKARYTVTKTAFDELKINNPTLLQEFVDYYALLRKELIEPFPGAIETLQTFKDRGIPMALITNGAKDVQSEKIDRFNLRPYFKNILIEGEFGTGKPDPQVFLHTLNILNAKPEDTWMIGDNLECDIAGAQALGIKTAWNNWEKQPLKTKSQIKPDLEIHFISELTSLPELS